MNIWVTIKSNRITLSVVLFCCWLCQEYRKMDENFYFNSTFSYTVISVRRWRLVTVFRARYLYYFWVVRLQHNFSKQSSIATDRANVDIKIWILGAPEIYMFLCQKDTFLCRFRESPTTVRCIKLTYTFRVGSVCG